MAAAGEVVVASGQFHHGPDGSWVYPAEQPLALPTVLPWLRKLYFRWELDFDGLPLLRFTQSHYYIGPLAAVLYLAACYAGVYFMRKRKAYNLKKPLAYWNLFLATFSIWGSIRLAPQVLHLLFRFGLNHCVCVHPAWFYLRGAEGFWAAAFNYSKLFETIDTAFLVLRKRPLKFLHWYHHATVLLYTWDTYVREVPAALFFTALNYFVHAVMYSYYYLAAVRARPPKWGKLVTVLQIAQMYIGAAVTGVSLYNGLTKPYLASSTMDTALHPELYEGCAADVGNHSWGMLMYLTYFYLFAMFFVERYILKLGSSKLSADGKAVDVASSAKDR